MMIAVFAYLLSRKVVHAQKFGNAYNKKKVQMFLPNMAFDLFDDHKCEFMN